MVEKNYGGIDGSWFCFFVMRLFQRNEGKGWADLVLP